MAQDVREQGIAGAQEAEKDFSNASQPTALVQAAA